MNIKTYKKRKSQFKELLLLGDENESMIARYIEKSVLYALYDDTLRGVCAVCRVSSDVVELKNIAVYPEFQKQGYGTILLKFISDMYRGAAKYLIAGTGETNSGFYIKNGFEYSHRVENFFRDNYPFPIYEDGVELVDMIYFRKLL